MISFSKILISIGREMMIPMMTASRSRGAACQSRTHQVASARRLDTMN